MRIGINALYLIPGQVGGTEIYLRHLLEAMIAVAPQHEYLIFSNRETLCSPMVGVTVPISVSAANRPARIAAEQTLLPVQAARSRIDVLLNAGFTSPLLAPCPQVTVFHDLQHKRHPEHFRWFDLPAWRALLFASAIGSEHLISVSNATKSDLLRYYPIPPRKITVVPHGVDERMFTLPRRPRGYLLCVSTLHPHKNIERLIRVFARLRASHPGLRLVLAGMRGFHTQAIEQAAASLQDSVDITGWIERERLYELYAGADAFVYPSTFEGFGMPVLEALAAGIPTACSDIEPLRSMAGGAAVLFHPHKDRSMLEALERVLQSRTSRGPARAHQFSWDAAARATLKALSIAAGLPTES